jgi:hypothetical protein
MTEPELSTSRRPVIIVACVVLLIAVGVILWRNLCTPCEPLPADYSKLLKTARDAQLKGDWCASREAFQKLSDKLKSDKSVKSVLAELRDEVDRNQRMLKVLCPGEVTPMSIPIPAEGEEVDVPAKKTLPEKLPEEVLLERYPVGKTIRSVGISEQDHASAVPRLCDGSSRRKPGV